MITSPLDLMSLWRRNDTVFKNSQAKFRVFLPIQHQIAAFLCRHGHAMYRPHAKDLDSLVKWIPKSTIPHTNLLVHNIFPICQTFLDF